MSSSGESSEGEEAEMRRMVRAHNRKKKKSGGFQAMGLSSGVFKAVIRKGYKLPTPIQRKTIPLIMDGKDVVAMARTGSGKTAAFLVPLLERLKMHLTTGPRALILSPTRELALQTLQFTRELGKFLDLKAAVILGGDKIEDQFAAMHEHPDIIIATPGRLLHVLVEMNKSLKEIVYVVFDEADRLFEMGFAEQLKEIIHRVPETRQTVLFSATLPNTLVSFAQAGLSDPTLVRLDVDTKLSAQLKMSFLWCRAEDKTAMLLYLLRHVITPDQLTVVFVATKHHVEYLHTLLTNCGVESTYIYSSLDQTARKIHVAKFTGRKVKVMVVTDLAARGIDIPHLDNVVNFHFPAKAKLFVHRVGRVARAGRSGRAFSLVAADEVSYLIDLHVFLGRQIMTVPSNTEVTDADGYFGNIPRSVVSDQWDELQQVNSESVDLQTQQKVCENAYKQYLRSRPPAASESIKRAKALEKERETFGLHPIFNGVVDKADDFHQHALSVLRNCKGRATIFEINATAKKACHSVMREKRKMHDHIIKKTHDTSTSAFSTLTSGSRDPASINQSVEELDEEELLEAFKKPASSSAAGDKKKRKEKKKKATMNRNARDEENYVLYQPSNTHTEAGYKMDSFKSQIHNAVLDFTGDDEQNMKSLNNTRKWDRKRKRFVTESNNGKTKKVKTESGNWIPASYKSKLYATWKNKEKMDARDDDSDDGGHHSNRGGNRGGGGRGGRRGGLTIAGTRVKKWHTKGTEPTDGPPGGNTNTKRKFKGGKRGGGGELKSKDKILSERRKKSKVQAFQKHRQVVRNKKQANRKKK